MLACRQYDVNALYNFETWGRQLSAFIAEIVGEPAFLICNSVGGEPSEQLLAVSLCIVHTLCEQHAPLFVLC